MTDLHCHLLPGIDDGADSLETALEMARCAVADGVGCVVCTPHVYPGAFPNERADILRRVEDLRRELAEHGIPLQIRHGAEVHLVPELIRGLQAGRIATIDDTRYLLLEPPQFSAPLRFVQSIDRVLASGYVPIIAHPERLDWLDDAHYERFVDAVDAGAWIQLTAGSLTGGFGRRAQHWAERFLADGLVAVLGSDGHDARCRPPSLTQGLRVAEHQLGMAEAERLVLDRPRAVLANADPLSVEPPPALAAEDAEAAIRVSQRGPGATGGLLRRLFRGGTG